jgi:putative ABC transport system ATP-binding protein
MTTAASAPQPTAESAKGANAPIVALGDVTKTFVRGKEPLTVLERLTLDVPEGSFEALMGPSGSGKSALLNLVAGLDRPSSGTVLCFRPTI